MSDSKTELLAPSDLNILASMEVKNEDLIAVAVARRERALEKRLLDAERTYTRIGRQLDAQAKLAEKELVAIVEKEYAERVAALKVAFESFGRPAKVQLLPVFRYEEKKILTMLRSGPERGSCGENSLSMELSLDAPESMLTLMAESEALREQLNTCIVERVELKKALSNMATTERRARAALAEASLASSERGRALLAAMNDMPDLLTVPALDVSSVDVAE